MRRKKRTETTIEAHQYFVVRGPEKPVLAWCPACDAQTRMVAPEVAAILCSVTTLTAYRWVQDARIHFTETPEGALVVCLNSLPVSAGQMEEQRLIE